jgi:hypothetical protein
MPKTVFYVNKIFEIQIPSLAIARSRRPLRFGSDLSGRRDRAMAKEGICISNILFT